MSDVTHLRRDTLRTVAKYVRASVETAAGQQPLLDLDAQQVTVAKAAMVKAWKRRAASGQAASPEEHVDALVGVFIDALRINMRGNKESVEDGAALS